MKKKEILFIAGARPNFMKVAPLIGAFSAANSRKSFLMHTGQHYDAVMSKAIFEDLGTPKPNANLMNFAGFEVGRRWAIVS